MGFVVRGDDEAMTTSIKPIPSALPTWIIVVVVIVAVVLIVVLLMIKWRKP